MIVPVRIEPIIGRKVWFGPRRFGWGLGPVSVEGWIVTTAMVLLSVLARADERRRKPARAVIGVLALVTFLKGTAPGGPKARRAFLEARGSAQPSEDPQFTSESPKSD